MMAEPGMRRWLCVGLAGVMLAVGAAGLNGQQVSKVRAVLFYSPTCPHCHQVMTVDLPPLLREFGDRLQIVSMSTATPAGERLYLETVRELAIPEARLGVPTLVVGSTVLVGSGEIPARFPGIVRQALAGGGTDWPAVPGIRQLLELQGLLDAPPAATVPVPAPVAADTAAAVPARQAEAAPARDSAPAAAQPSRAQPAANTIAADSAGVVPGDVVPAPNPAAPPVPDVGMLDLTGAQDRGGFARFRTDPVGNTLAAGVLLGMLLALAAVAAAVAGRLTWRPGPRWLTPVLAVLGIGVASYLAYVEVTGATAVCGPVGDCNTVQQSPYARIAGLVPVGIAGALGYALLLGTWAVAVAGPLPSRPFALVVLWAATLLGTLFSVFLTFLEPFVIGATCAWCVTSALVMTLLLLLATPAALAVRAGKPPAPTARASITGAT